MSSAPHEPTYGTARAGDGVEALGARAEDTAHQFVGDFRGRDVEHGRQADPESTSFSIDWPPVPVAWKVRQSNFSSSRPITACTQGVVTPNMVRPIAGFERFVDSLRAAPCIIPPRACAAFASTRSEIRLRQDTSVTEYIMQMSDGPT